MTNEPNLRAMQKRVRRGFSCMYGFHFTGMSAGAFNVLLLNSYGFSSAQVGLIIAAYSAVGILAPPIWGYVADRMGSMEKTYRLVFILQGILLFSLPFFGAMHWGGVCALAFMLPVSNFVRTCSTNLLDAWVVKSINQVGHVAFGVVRSWGSLTWTITCLILSAVSGVLGLSAVFYICGILCLLTALFAGKLRKSLPLDDALKDGSQPVKAEDRRKINPFRLLGNYYFVLFLLMIFATQMTMNCTSSFSPYIYQALGADPSISASSSGIKALMEIPFLLLGARLLRRYSLPALIVCTGCCLGLEQFLYTQVGSPVLVMLVTLCFNGMGAGLFFTTSIEYAHRLSPPELKASAQTFVGMAGALGHICSSLLGGQLIDSFGVFTLYRTTALLAFAISLLFALSFPFAKRVLHLHRPDNTQPPRKSIPNA